MKTNINITNERFMLVQYYRYYLLIFLTLLISGCSTTAFIQKVTPVNSSLSAYNKAFISVKGKSKSIENTHGFEISKSDLEIKFISNLTEAKLFNEVSSQVTKNNDKGAIIINLIIEELSYLSGASSIMGGIMTGNARFKVLAQLKEAETGKKIGEIRSGAQTSSSGGIFRGSTSGQITSISKKLVNELSSYK